MSKRLQSSLQNIVFHSYKMPFGHVTIASDGSSITQVALGDVTLDGAHASDALTNECANQLVEYMSGKRTVFELPISPQGSQFQQQVWDAIKEIPYSQTRTSAEIADAIGRPNSYRMVGAAVRENPIAIIIPAHRVVAANGHVSKCDMHDQLRAAFRELEQRFA